VKGIQYESEEMIDIRNRKQKEKYNPRNHCIRPSCLDVVATLYFTSFAEIGFGKAKASTDVKCITTWKIRGTVIKCAIIQKCGHAVSEFRIQSEQCGISLLFESAIKHYYRVKESSYGALLKNFLFVSELVAASGVSVGRESIYWANIISVEESERSGGYIY
jgi:hypothetical protein